MPCSVKKIILGTVQFGLNYGISNASGQPDEGAVSKILLYAKSEGIASLDTAACYGNAEGLLGRLVGQDDFRIITKTLPIDVLAIDNKYLSSVCDRFYESLKLLKQKKVDGLMVHHGEDMLKPGADKLFQLLLRLKGDNLVEKIGISIYDPDVADSIISRYPIDLIQLPFNIVDQRAKKRGLLERLNGLGVEVHARSVFLQGALLMDPNRLPKHLATLSSVIIKLRRVCAIHNSTVHEACLKFATETSGIDKVVCGVNSLIELEQLIGNYHSSHENFDCSLFAIDDPLIINPSNWPKRDM